MKKTFSILMVGLILMAEFVPISAALLETYMKATGLSTNSGDTNSDTPDLTYTAGTWVSATRVFTVASGNPVTDGVTVGRLVALRVDGGAAAVLIGRVSARDATTITLAATDLAGSLADRTGDCTLVMGGRYKGPDGANFIPFTLATTGALRSAAGDKLRVNAIGTFDWLQAYTFAANGPYIFEGMTATPGDGGKARWNGDTNLLPYNFVNLSGINDIIFKHHIMQGNGYLFPATNGGPSLINLTGTGFSLESCVISNTYRNAINLVGDGWLIAKSLFEHCNQDSGNGFAAIAISRSGVLEDS
ncbi:MAG TPA: hypothetical protein VHO25_04920, partial [Polyangiaceae bacterium]|nr:hypothetical protein [Polyangiaceae bacterium]